MGVKIDSRPGGGPVTATTTRAYGREAIVVRNRTAEIVIVPGIGRVMGFGLRAPGNRAKGPSRDARDAHDGRGGRGLMAGPFWSHPEIEAGVQPDGEGWTNYGGDKALPAPQSDWPKVTGRGWPPPKGFDASPHTATVDDGGRVQLLSAVDPDYGIRVRRTIELDADRPVMTIETTYEKLRGTPVRVAVWTVTQLGPPERLFVLLPGVTDASAAFPRGYVTLLPDAPSSLRTEGRLLSLAQDARKKTMIASDGRALLWLGKGPDLLVQLLDDPTTTATTPAPAASTPDAGRGPGHDPRSQIYTNPAAGPLAYVELELLGPVSELAPGQKTSARQRYTLIRRTIADPRREARAVFGLH